MSLQELERDILKLPMEERARLVAWLNDLPPITQEYPSQECEQMAEGYIGSDQHQADKQAIREGIEDSLAGRVTPLHIADARMRAKYNIRAMQSHSRRKNWRLLSEKWTLWRERVQR